MFVGRFVMFALAILSLITFTSHALCEEAFQVGESVVVAAENADVLVGERKLGTVPRGTEFKIRQLAPSYLMGEFRLGNRTVIGWVSEEAVGRLHPGSQETAKHEFNWENLLYAMIKLDKRFDFEAQVDDYLKAFRSAVWKQYRNDEFRLAEKRAEALDAFREVVEEFDLSQEFLINTSLTMAKYDFERSAFPIEEATDTHYWYETRYVDGEFPDQIKVFFKNSDLIGCIPLPPDDAERFLAMRKDSRGDVDRQVQAKVYIRIISLKDSDGELWSEIRWAQFFSDSDCKTLLYETPRPPAESPGAKEIESDASKTGEAVGK